MSKPVLAAAEPVKVELVEGKNYFWCCCGLSKKQPYCDGSHQGTGLEPKKFQAEASKAYYVCQCKATLNQPFCDGTHQKLRHLNPGDPVS